MFVFDYLDKYLDIWLIFEYLDLDDIYIEFFFFEIYNWELRIESETSLIYSNTLSAG